MTKMKQKDTIEEVFMNDNTLRNVEFLSQNTKPIGLPFERGNGCEVYNTKGEKFIDCCSQTLNLALGQCNEDINKAIKEELDKITFVSSRYGSNVQLELVSELLKILPKELNRINLKNTSGSSANENAIKMARKKTGKQKIVAVMHSHHGQTHEMMAISGKHWDKKYLDKSNVLYVDCPNCYRCQYKNNCKQQCLDKVMNKKDILKEEYAGFIIEPIMVDAGVIIPPREYHIKIRELCDECDMALIYDEVQTGFGWLGTFLATNLYDVIPDILTIGKAFGAGFPLAACISKEEFDVLTYGEHEITYGAHPVLMAGAIANIRYLKDEGLKQVDAKAKTCKDKFRELMKKYPMIGDVRSSGLLFGIEFIKTDTGEPNSELARSVYLSMLEKGIILRISKVGVNSNVVQFKPPIIISEEQIDTVFIKVDETLKEQLK